MLDNKKKRDLLIHIGLPKSASTTLQFDVFTQFEALYLGRKKNSYSHNIVMSDFCHTVGNPTSKNLEKNSFEIKNFISRLKKHINNQNKMIILSEEAITCPDYFNFYPFANVWQRKLIRNRYFWEWVVLLKEEWRKEFGGDVKILIVLRNQVNFLLSLYSQFSLYNINASQEDFEIQTMKLLEDPYYSNMIDYFQILKSQIKTFGENLEILFFEEITTNLFWNWCKKYSMENKFDNSIVGKNNVRSLDKLGSKYPIPSLGTQDSFLRAFKLQPWRIDYLILSQKYKLCSKYREALNLRRKKQDPIKMTPNLSTLILKKYSKNNLKLAKLLKKNLNNIGYY